MGEEIEGYTIMNLKDGVASEAKFQHINVHSGPFQYLRTISNVSLPLCFPISSHLLSVSCLSPLLVSPPRQKKYTYEFSYMLVASSGRF